jgi:hypothetical protein
MHFLSREARMRMTINRLVLCTLNFGSAFFFALPGPAFAWDITANFEQGILGQEAQGISGFDDAFSQTLYSNERVNTGAKSAKVSWLQGSDGWGQSGGLFNYPAELGEGDELWVRGYFYFQSPWSWTSSPVVKVLRGVRIKNSSGVHIGYLSVFSDTNGQITLSNEVGDYQQGTGVYFDRDRWQSIEMYVKLSAMTPIFRIWKDGVLIFEDTTHRTLNSSFPSDKADFAYVFTYWNGGVPQNQVSYVDDFVFTTTRPSKQDAQGNYMIGPIESILTLNPVSDTFININSTTYESDPELHTYTWPDNKIANAILMKFDLSSIPVGATIQSATLNLYLTGFDSTGDNTYTVTVHKNINKDPAVNNATGYTYDGVNGWTANICCYNNIPLAQADISAAYDTQGINKTASYKSWNVTTLIQEWINNPSTNFGLLLNSDPSKLRDRWRYFASMNESNASKHPYLTVTYTP